MKKVLIVILLNTIFGLSGCGKLETYGDNSGKTEQSMMELQSEMNEELHFPHSYVTIKSTSMKIVKEGQVIEIEFEWNNEELTKDEQANDKALLLKAVQKETPLSLYKADFSVKEQQEAVSIPLEDKKIYRTSFLLEDKKERVIFEFTTNIGTPMTKKFDEYIE